MMVRAAAVGVAAVIVCAAAWGQNKPAAGGKAGSGIGAAVEKEVAGLGAEDFREREAALRRLQALLAQQVRQRAEIQTVLDDLQLDLAQQQRALAMVIDEEAKAQISGLLEMERGIAGWTAQVMSEPIERRKALLEWGLGRAAAPVLARVYAENRRVRLAGIKDLARLPEDAANGVSWTISRLINDRDTPTRAAAMAACWDHKASPDIVEALWFRAVTGPEGRSASGIDLLPRAADSQQSLKVDFPGGDPMEFDDENEAAAFEDALLAGDVLVHLNSPLVAQRIRALVEERSKAARTLVSDSDPDWTLATHRLVEAYGVKEAIGMLAEEALAARSDENGGEANGRPYMWSSRTMAIGAAAKLAGKDPSDFQVMRVRGSEDPRGWVWAVDGNPGLGNGGRQSPDGAAVAAFYAWWKDHHGEYGVKDEPSTAGLPRPGRGRRGGGVPPPAVREAPPGGNGGDPAVTAPAAGRE